MREALTIAVKAVNGGLFVVLFALLGEIAVPKRFAGLFSAAPSIAMANLLVIVLVKGHDDAQAQATGMIVGGVAMVAACAAGLLLIKHFKALRGSLLLCGTWAAVALAGFVAVLR